MAVDLSKWPLLVFMEHVNEWKDSARSDAFWETLTEHTRWANRLRDEAKGLIVWMELNGLADQASQLDKRMEGFRKELWTFQKACEGTFPPEDWHCREQRETLIDSASLVAGIAEDLNDEVAEAVWEGFGYE